MDAIAATIIERDVSVLINTSFTVALAITGTDAAITVSDHTRRYSDMDKAVTGATLTTDENGDPIAAHTNYLLSYDDEARAGGAVTYTAHPPAGAADAFTSPANPYRHFVGYITTDVVGGTGTGGGGALPPGGGGVDAPI
jgi:hypothetical protein